MEDCNLVGLAIMAGGLFALAAAACDWEWFLNHPRAKVFTWLLGRTGARVFYALVGLGLTGLGGAVLVGAVGPGGKKKVEKPDIIREMEERDPHETRAPGISDDKRSRSRPPKPSGMQVTLWNASAYRSGAGLTVDYRFDKGSPSRSTTYHLVIEGEDGEVDFRLSGRALTATGTLRGQAIGGMPRSPHAYLATGATSYRSRISNRVPVTIRSSATTARKPSTQEGQTPPKETWDFLRALAALQSADPETRKRGAIAFQKLPVDEARREEAAAALAKLLANRAEPARRPALRALDRWIAPVAIPAIADCIRDPGTRLDALRMIERLKPVEEHRQQVAGALAAALSDKSPAVTTRALRALGEWHAPGAIPAMARYLDDQGLRPMAVEALAKTGDPRAAEALVACFVGGYSPAGHGLRKMGQVAEKPLLQHVRHKDKGVRQDCHQILGAIGGKASYDVLVPMTRDPDPVVAKMAEMTMGRIRTRHPELPPPREPTPAERVVQLLAQLAEDQDYRRRNALQELTKLEPVAGRREEVAQKIVPFLSAKSIFTRQQAIKALGQWHTEATLAALVACAKDPNALVRGDAYDALAEVKTPEVAKVIAARLADDRVRATRALVAMGPVAEEVVLKYTGHRDKRAQMAALDVLAKIGTKKSIPTLRRLLKHKDFLIRSYAKTAGRAILAREKK